MGGAAILGGNAYYFLFRFVEIPSSVDGFEVVEDSFNGCNKQQRIGSMQSKPNPPPNQLHYLAAQKEYIPQTAQANDLVFVDGAFWCDLGKFLYAVFGFTSRC